jgi:hypothetical protein
MNREEMQQYLEGNAADPSLVEDTSLMQEQMDNIGYGGGGDEEVEE